MYIGKRNATFQQWQTLLTNRRKRGRAGEFLVQGVRPITVAVESGHPVTSLLARAEGRLSSWAQGVIDALGVPVVELAPELIAELGDRADEPPELIAVAAMPPDDLGRITAGPGFLGAVFDRPSSPGNLGTVIRSADAFGLDGVIVTGHAADPYDPQAVRASTGSLFAVPAVRVPGHAPVLDWLPDGVQIVGTDEHGDADIAGHDLTGPTLLLIGNETAGLSEAWRAACHRLVRIPIGGSASSLNAANAAAIAFYEARRQRGGEGRGPGGAVGVL